MAAAGLLCACLLLAGAAAQGVGGHAYGRSVDLARVQALTFRDGKWTEARRTRSIPQLKCVGGCEYRPDVVQCVNVGSDGFDVQWRCEADLPTGLRFGATEVVCEGYDSSADRMVLEGSCGLEYSLKRVSGASRGGYVPPRGQGTKKLKRWNLGQWAMLAFLCYILYSILRSYVPYYFRSNRGRPGGRPTFGSWGGFRNRGTNWGSSDYPPPDHRPPPSGSHGPDGSTGSFGGGYPGVYGAGPSQKMGTSTTTNTGGGLFGGWGRTAAGFGLGYFLGNFGGAGRTAQTQAGPREARNAGSFWGAGRTNSWARGRDPRQWSAGTSTTSAEERPKSEGFGGETRTATAYASTRRR
eukprot:SM000006S19452  [mRNA]  locus=s6:832622:834841:+ [translate_table: standard]